MNFIEEITSNQYTLDELCHFTNIETAIETLLIDSGTPAFQGTRTATQFEQLVMALKELANRRQKAKQARRTIKLLTNAAYLSLRLSQLSSAALLTTSAYIINSGSGSGINDNANDYDVIETLITHLNTHSISLQSIHAVITGILTHSLTPTHPIQISELLLRYSTHLQHNQHHPFIVSLAQHSPTLINILALSHHAQPGTQLTTRIIELDDIAIVNDWANEAKLQIKQGNSLQGVQRLTHLIKRSILHAFFLQLTGEALDDDRVYQKTSQPLPTIDAPPWFKQQSANFASTQKVYSSNEFRTLRMAAQGIRAPSKHLDQGYNAHEQESKTVRVQRGKQPQDAKFAKRPRIAFKCSHCESRTCVNDSIAFLLQLWSTFCPV
ncbi:hypothetical protein E3P91_02808 [Wallemia ichthyophaga]|nr:hypothetical protein E3P91_02808 [Wallemia ichthyophaga]